MEQIHNNCGTVPQSLLAVCSAHCPQSTLQAIITITYGGISASLPCFMEWKDIRIQMHVIHVSVMRDGGGRHVLVHLSLDPCVVIFIYLGCAGSLWLCKGFRLLR